jgi:hypothetical protein
MDETMNIGDLENYFLDFSSLGTKMYDAYLRFYTRAQIAETLGYKSPNKTCGSHITHLRKAGRYRAIRFLSLCLNFKINPRKVFKEFPPKLVIRGKSRMWQFEEVNDEEKQSVLKTICETYDNKSQVE